MKQYLIELMKKVEVKSGDDTCYLKYHSDHSGGLIVWGEEVFDFDGEDELKSRLTDYLK